MSTPDTPLTLTQDDAETLNVHTPYQGFAKLNQYEVRHKRYDGTWTPPLKRELFESGDAVVVLPYDPETDEVVLIEQFRISAHARGISPWVVECIAGRVNEGEQPEQVALREAKEEANCTLNNLVKIGEMFSSPGIFAEYATYFCAQVDSRTISGIHGLDSEQEDIRPRVMAFEDAMQALYGGEIIVAPAIVCLQWLALNRERLRTEWRGEA
jgi:ADP-ribose pyrophosphatase